MKIQISPEKGCFFLEICSILWTLKFRYDKSIQYRLMMVDQQNSPTVEPVDYTCGGRARRGWIKM